MSPRDTGFSGLHCLPDIVPQGQTLLPGWRPVGSSRHQKGASVSLVALPLNPSSAIGPPPRALKNQPPARLTAAAAPPSLCQGPPWGRVEPRLLSGQEKEHPRWPGTGGGVPAWEMLMAQRWGERDPW